MIHCIPFLAVIALTFTSEASAQDGIEGTYIHSQTGRACHVFKRGRSYIFENEKGQQAKFAYSGPNQLSVTEAGKWDRNIQAHITQGRDGRVVIRFAVPPVGFVDYWTARR